MHLGADLCCDSLHKTLPVLTGGAMLHVGDTPLTRQHGFVRNAKDAMHLFGSTSPSYLVMLSMDTLLPALYDGSFRQEVAYTVRQVEKLRQLAAGQGFLLPEGETLPTRLTLVYSPLGCTRAEFDAACTARRCGAGISGGPCLCVPLFCPEPGGGFPPSGNPDPHPAPQGAADSGNGIPSA